MCIRVEPNRLLEYKPSFPWAIFIPKGQFVIEPRGGKSCVFTATISLRVGPLFKKFGRKRLEAVKQHMKEEGENLKKILEKEED